MTRCDLEYMGSRRIDPPRKVPYSACHCSLTWATRDAIAALEIEDQAQIVPTFSSRWCQQTFVAPSYKHDPEPFIEYLEHLLDNNKVRVLIPAADGTLAVIRQYRERLQRRTNIALAKEEALAVAINKDQTLALAEELGLVCLVACM